MKLPISIVLISALSSIGLAEENHRPAASLDELRQQLEAILNSTHTPGASVAIVGRDGPEWVGGLGLADVATGRKATEDTLFRIGSVSKGFVSLSILLLARHGKISLDDPVRKYAPEVWFENRWEAMFFAISAVTAALLLWRAPAGAIRTGVRAYSVTVTLALLIATAYLAYWGVIGLRTWV